MGHDLTREPLADHELATLLCLLHIAWSDHHFGPEEHQALRAEVLAMELPVGDRELLTAALAVPPATPEDLARRVPGAAHRRELLRAASRIACSDGVVTESERLALQDLARAFEVPCDERDQILAEARTPRAAGAATSALPRQVYEHLRALGAKVAPED